MRLTCPECGAEISAENTNMKEMTAICDECNAFFRFDTANRKRRKVPQPARLAVEETPERLSMNYRRVLTEEERGIAIGNGVFALVLPFILLTAINGGAPLLILLLFALWVLVSWYVQIAMMFNKTTITADDDRLIVDNGILPWFAGVVDATFNMGDVAEIICEETEKSRQNAPVNRFYHVRAILADGNQVTLLRGMPQEYAFYIAQELNAEMKSGQVHLSTQDQDFFDDALNPPDEAIKAKSQ